MKSEEQFIANAQKMLSGAKRKRFNRFTFPGNALHQIDAIIVETKRTGTLRVDYNTGGRSRVTFEESDAEQLPPE